MARYRLTASLNDDKRDVPPHEVEVRDMDELAYRLADECANDYDQLFGVGFTLLVERIA